MALPALCFTELSAEDCGIILPMSYFIFVQDSNDLEKLVAEAPSLAMAQQIASRMSQKDLPGHPITSAIVCERDAQGNVVVLSTFHRDPSKHSFN